jgi:hypothetical protein
MGGGGSGGRGGGRCRGRGYEIRQGDILTACCVQNGRFLAVAEESLKILIPACTFSE